MKISIIKKIRIKYKFSFGIFMLVTILAMIYDPYLITAIIYHTVIGMGIMATFEVKKDGNRNW